MDEVGGGGPLDRALFINSSSCIQASLGFLQRGSVRHFDWLHGRRTFKGRQRDDECFRESTPQQESLPSLCTSALACEAWLFVGFRYLCYCYHGIKHGLSKCAILV